MILTTASPVPPAGKPLIIVMVRGAAPKTWARAVGTLLQVPSAKAMSIWRRRVPMRAGEGRAGGFPNASLAAFSGTGGCGIVRAAISGRGTPEGAFLRMRAAPPGDLRYLAERRKLALPVS